MPPIDVVQILERGAIGGRVIPYRNLEKYCAETEEDLRDVILPDRLAKIFQRVDDLVMEQLQELFVEEFGVDLANTEGRVGPGTSGDGGPGGGGLRCEGVEGRREFLLEVGCL